jgi:hypothetical protein
MGLDLVVSILNPSDSTWAAIICGVHHDVYHLPEYVGFAARREGGEPIAVFAEWDGGWLLIPLVLCPVPGGLSSNGGPLCDASSPYGYSAPLASVRDVKNGEVSSQLRAAFQACVRALESRGVVSMFVRLHPLLPFPLEVLEDFGRTVHHGETIYIDLSESDDNMWKQTRSTHRQDIVRAQKRGAIAYIDQDWRHFDEFFDIYHETMRRVRAADYYLFSKDHFVDLRRALGDRVSLSVVEIDGSVAAAGIVTEVGGIVETHFAGTRDTFLKWSPNKVRIDFLRSWAKSRGNRYLHLGGGVGGRRDSLFEFKLGFSPHQRAFHTGRLVLNAKVYHDGVVRWESAHGTRADDINGFFPPYRKSSHDELHP